MPQMDTRRLGIPEYRSPPALAAASQYDDRERHFSIGLAGGGRYFQDALSGDHDPFASLLTFREARNEFFL